MEKTEGKIRYGLIGIGAQGGSYARFLTNAPAPFPGMVCAPCPDNCALGALCDIDPEKEKMCKEQYPDVPFFKDWKDMIASGTVDAIITTVPHYLHHEISIYAMEHGMNVLCEKPAGVRSKDVQKMIACAKAHPEVSFGIMFNQRTNKLYQKIKEIVASGELGEIRRSQWMINSWWRPDSYYQQSAWRATWGGEGGGVGGEQRHGAVRPGEPKVAGPLTQQQLSTVALAVQAHVVGRGAQAAVGDAQVQAVHHPALAVGEGQARPGGQRGLPDGEGAAVEGVGGGPRGGGRVAGGEVAGHGVDQRGRAVEVRVHGEDDGRGGGDVLAV